MERQRLTVRGATWKDFAGITPAVTDGLGQAPWALMAPQVGGIEPGQMPRSRADGKAEVGKAKQW